MSQTEFFKYLGAPLANVRWSWGAVRAEDGAVFIRVWTHEAENVDGTRVVRVTYHKEHRNNPTLAYRERLKHVELIEQGAKCFLIYCTAVDTNVHPWRIRHFIDDRIWVGDGLVQRQDESWIGVGAMLKVDEARNIIND